MLLSVFFFFKQKTAYEMRISDWSSDVCSSDLAEHGRENAQGSHYPCQHRRKGNGGAFGTADRCGGLRQSPEGAHDVAGRSDDHLSDHQGQAPGPTEDRKSVVEGKSVSVRVDPGGRRHIKKKKKNKKIRK